MAEVQCTIIQYIETYRRLNIYEEVMPLTWWWKTENIIKAYIVMKFRAVQLRNEIYGEAA